MEESICNASSAVRIENFSLGSVLERFGFGVRPSVGLSSSCGLVSVLGFLCHWQEDDHHLSSRKILTPA